MLTIEKARISESVDEEMLKHLPAGRREFSMTILLAQPLCCHYTVGLLQLELLNGVFSHLVFKDFAGGVHGKL